MTNINTEGLPPEMQARIAEIIEKAKSNAITPTNAPVRNDLPQLQAPVRPPTLMDHTVALRQEVAALRQELHAVAQVTDAVGQAVGQLYQSFLGQSEYADNGGAYEAQAPDEMSDY